jgi:intracellular sulfur oxidation DsrE/DsrF family protein
MENLRLIIHAPTAGALERGRRNLANLLKQAPTAKVELVINAGAVAAALDAPSPLDSHLRVCRNTLEANQFIAPDGINVVAAAVLHIAQRQAEGWAYMRA